MDAPGDVQEQVRRGLHLVTGRIPSSIEIEEGLAFVRDLTETEGMDEISALATFCLVALNLNEFLYVD